MICQRQVWRSLNKKQLTARGVNVKLKLKNFQVLQHSKSFKQALQSEQDLAQVIFQLLNEMHIDPTFQFRLVGVGVYQLQPMQQESQLSLW
jgi:DNA polymerase-4